MCVCVCVRACVRVRVCVCVVGVVSYPGHETMVGGYERGVSTFTTRVNGSWCSSHSLSGCVLWSMHKHTSLLQVMLRDSGPLGSALPHACIVLDSLLSHCPEGWSNTILKVTICHPM